MTTMPEIREAVEECTVPITSDEAQEIVESGVSHVSLLWDDGEITTTKAGDLFGRRRLHQVLAPWAAEGMLFDVPEVPQNPFTGAHEARVIVDREPLESAIRSHFEMNDMKVRGHRRLGV